MSVPFDFRILCHNASLECLSRLPFLHHFDCKFALIFHLALSDGLSDRVIHHNTGCKDDVCSHHDDDYHADLLAVFWNNLRVGRDHQKILHDQDDCLASESLAQVVLSLLDEWVV